VPPPHLPHPSASRRGALPEGPRSFGAGCRCRLELGKEDEEDGWCGGAGVWCARGGIFSGDVWLGVGVEVPSVGAWWWWKCYGAPRSLHAGVVMGIGYGGGWIWIGLESTPTGHAKSRSRITRPARCPCLPAKNKMVSSK
jgi:hypothetical protein